ncbi:type I-E CRISPR-associated protein Cse2/CasB [Streptomyces sp. PU-14G]|uniref:type I-E CRISPR-associated protein Cse2/CasB n=1 Tax=Streptomyces sp. PU-14G TaxID=2800808 RepID=UPI0034DE4264
MCADVTIDSTPPSAPGGDGTSHRSDGADRFIVFVQELCRNPRARGALRREQGRPLNRSPETARHLSQRIPRQMTETSLRARYAVARLIAAQVRARRDDEASSTEPSADGPVTAPLGMGAALAAAVGLEALAQRSAELELDKCASSSQEAVLRRLPSLMPLLRDVPVDWAALLRDLDRWDSHRDKITSRWQRSFYRARARAEDVEPPEGREGFVAAVLALCQEPGARTDLAKGLGLPVEKCHPLHGHLVRLLPPGMHPAAERAHYAVAALIADRPPRARNADPETDGAQHHARSGDLGTALAQGVDRQFYRGHAAEADLHLIARQGTDALHRRLPALLRRLQNGGVTIDWVQLIGDLSWWEQHRERIAARWLSHYFDFRPTRPSGDHHN